MSDIPDELVDVRFDCIDYAEDGGHPGIESHKLYANEIINYFFTTLSSVISALLENLSIF